MRHPSPPSGITILLGYAAKALAEKDIDLLDTGLFWLCVSNNMYLIEPGADRKIYFESLVFQVPEGRHCPNGLTRALQAIVVMSWHIDWWLLLLFERVIQYPCLRVYIAQIHVDLNSRFFEFLPELNRRPRYYQSRALTNWVRLHCNTTKVEFYRWVWAPMRRGVLGMSSVSCASKLFWSMSDIFGAYTVDIEG